VKETRVGNGRDPYRLYRNDGDEERIWGDIERVEPSSRDA
jgi:hypothetical protein